MRSWIRKKKIDSLSSVTKKSLPILKKHEVKKASIFGSFAKGTAKARSDVDFLIEYSGKNKSLFDLIDLKAELEEKLNRKVDIVTFNSIDRKLQKEILSEQIVIL